MVLEVTFGERTLWVLSEGAAVAARLPIGRSALVMATCKGG